MQHKETRNDMKIAKIKGKKIYHIVGGDRKDSIDTVPESYCGQFFLPDDGDTVTEVSAEAALELVRAGTLCRRCAKHLDACLTPPPPDIWRVECEKAIHEGVVLNRWNDFFKRSGPIEFYAEDFEENWEKYAKNLIKTYRDLIENQEAVLLSMLTHFLPIYEDWRTNVDFGHTEEKHALVMPRVGDIQQFSTMLRPRSIIIHWKKKKGIFCLGCHFDAPWDEEHGLGVMMHRDKPEKFGDGSTAG